MSKVMRLSGRNALIQEMMTDSEQLKDFYRFTAQNPHITLHDACQIVLMRPNASVCYAFEEWNAMDRRVTKGRKGIAYYDSDGNKQFVFDANDTHGNGRYKRLIYPMKRLLIGLDKLNNSSILEQEISDYHKIFVGVSKYLQQSGHLTSDDERNKLYIQGVAYSLYCKTGFPKDNGIDISGYKYSLSENAGLFKQVNLLSEYLKEEINTAYEISLESVKVVDDTEENTITDELPILEDNNIENVEQTYSIAKDEQSLGQERKNQITPYYQRYLSVQQEYPNAVVAIRLGDFYEVMGENAVKVSEMLDLMLVSRDVGASERVLMCGFPYHAKDMYLDKILFYNGVAVCEDDEIHYLPSQHELNVLKPEELAYEQFASDNSSDEMFEREEHSLLDSSFIDLEDNEYEEPQEEIKFKPIVKPKITTVKTKHSKDDSQISFFGESIEEKERTRKDQLIEWGLKRGSGFAQGKFRIYDEYLNNSFAKEFANFLKNEYGIGGMSSIEEEIWSDSKGFFMAWKDIENPENDVEALLSWSQVANGISNLILEDNYFTEKELAEYEQYKLAKIDEESSQTTWQTAEESDLNQIAEDEYPNESVIQTPNVEESQNTNLTELGFDQNEFGGAKARFNGNINAIKLMYQLENEKRLPTSNEKQVLTKYVGWGGLAEAFDERNERWRSEYDRLKILLPLEDYENAKASVLNAHYTSQEVIEGVYNALSHFGVSGNNKILEPAMGTGNFFGFMPQSISDNAKLYGVELDKITGKIAKLLYPNVNVQIKGFEQTTFTNYSFDIVITNVPFGAYSVYDSEYTKHNFMIHDYFIAKSIDKLKPNGLMAVITSKGTMDKISPTVRKHIADRAKLLGAIRLPNTAFKQTANTSVVADILFFQKREEQINSTVENTEWLSLSKTEDGYEINSYYVNHPEMILGRLVSERGMYGAVDITVKPDDRNLSLAISQAVENLPKDCYENPQVLNEDEQSKINEIQVDYDVKPLCFKAENGKVYMRIGDSMAVQELPKTPMDAYDRISAMVELRNKLRQILNLQISGASDEVLKHEQFKLNAQYDRFVKSYGFINSQTNTKLFRDDGDSALLFASENLSEDKKTATKTDIFSKRTIRPYSAPQSTEDCFEAMQISKNERGCVDIAYIEQLTKKDYDTVISELGSNVFRNPLRVNIEDKYSGFETSEEYLSGNVTRKLQTAIQFANEFKDFGYGNNVEALKEVQPEPLSASEISVRIGASWINKEYYKEFLCDLLYVPKYYRSDLELYYNPHDSSWRIDKERYVRSSVTMQSNEVYGTSRADAFRLFEDCLNLRSTQIFDTVQDGETTRRVLNKVETIAAREKQNQIKEAFKDWIFNAPERRENLELTYNSLFNQIRLPSYDGSYLHFPEMNPRVELKPHQKNAVHRIISGGKSNGNVLLHHVVGSGKTFTICASVMKLRQYGLAKKPMIAVPNHLVQQWASEFRMLYPNSKLLIASKEDLEKNNRKKFVFKVAMGDWDAVIIAQSSFAKIPISPDRQIKKIREELARIDESITDQWERSNMPRGAVKNLERIKKSRETMLKKLLDDDKKDNVLIFEDLGVDYLFVDEAHFYKNKFLFSKMNNVAGISTTASQRAADLELKVEYVNELHGGDKGVVFATGTPISNSMTEMFAMQSYLQKQTLQDLGITYFDGWAADFGETITSLEMSPSGQGYKARTRFAKFTNLPELLTLYRSFADVQTADMVKLNVPEAERHVINLKPSDIIIDLAEEIAERAERISQGNVDPHIDNMLKVTLDGKKLALDPRCYDRNIEDSGEGKLSECAKRVFDIWNETHDKKSTQIVFCDLSTPKKDFEDYVYGEDFDAYNELKYKLVQMGMPKEEIAYIHEAKSDLQKQALFNNVNSGKIRVLIGSTEKCGAGTNCQKRLIALHHLDTPYRPSDLCQREGRIIRQGNTNEKVHIFTYVTERTFDSYSYQILENKQRFIAQIDRGDLTVREADDIDETTLSYAEIKAITAANPKIKRKMELDSEVSRLRILEGRYKKNLYSLQDKIRKDYPEQIRHQEKYLEYVGLDIANIASRFSKEQFEINVQGKVYTDRKEGGRALMDALYSANTDTVVAEYGGFKISMNPIRMLTIERSIKLSANWKYDVDIGESASGTLTRLDNFIEDFPKKKDRAEIKLSELKRDFEIAKEQVQKPFEYRDTIIELVKELTQINAELDLNKREEVVIEENSEQDNSAADEEVTMFALPKKQSKTKQKTNKAYSPISNEVANIYDIKKADTDFLFVENGGYYQVLGDKAEEINNRYGYPLIKEIINGKECSIVSVDDFGLSRLTQYINEDNNTFKVLSYERVTDYIKETREVDFIDKIDKVAEMEVEVYPDYSVDMDDMHKYGYTWDGMLPIGKDMVYKLYKLDVPVYILKNDDSEIQIEDADEIDLHDGLFGIEKPDWNSFLQSDKARAYLKEYVEDSIYQDIDIEEELDKMVDEMTDKETEEFLGKGIFVPIYLKTGDYSFSHGELDLFIKSNKESRNCLDMIDSGISDNYKDYRLNIDFKRDIIDRFGLERVKYVLATVIQKMATDGRILDKNKAWANSIPVSESEDVRRDLYTDSHPGLLDMFVTSVIKYEKEMDSQNNQDIKASNDNMESAETAPQNVDYRQNVKERVKHEYSVFYDETMSKSPKEIFEDNYKIRFNEEIKEYFTNDEIDYLEDIHYKALDLDCQNILGDLYQYYLKYENSSINSWSDTTDFIVSYNEKYNSDILAEKNNYEEEKEDLSEKRDRLKVSVPNDALIGIYEKSSLFKMPSSSRFSGYSYYIPNSMAHEDRDSEDGRILINIPEDFVIKMKSRAEGAKEVREITAFEFKDICDNTNAEDYVFNRNNENNDKQETQSESKKDISNENSGYNYIFITEEARIAEYEGRTLFKMPNGEYEGYCYYIPNKLLKANEENAIIRLSIPDGFEVTLLDNKNDRKIVLSASDFVASIKDKTIDDYKRILQQSANKKFAQVEKDLRSKIPEEMKARPNWCIARTRKNEEKDRLDKFLIDCNTGKFARSDDPATWTDFESACKYAKENGGETLAYVLDGKDNICCIDLDGAINDKGEYSPLAKDMLAKSGLTYAEKSISGKGLHIFGKTNGLDIRAFSREGDLEFYQKAHSIMMTGDMINDTKLLVNFDNTEVKDLLESKCSKRTAFKGESKGIEGLSIMSDRDVVERAEKAKNGDTFKALYSGQDLQNNHSNSDMSLMNRLAFWCNGDREQMLRIFVTSGLYRPEKSPDYYEGTAIKAIRDTTMRYETKAESKPQVEPAKQYSGNEK